MAEAMSSRHSGEVWTEEQAQQLRELAGANTPVGVMSVKLGRSEAAIRSKAQSEGIALAPPNRSPYGDMS
ncbi:hypothetical protein [Kribbella sp. NPDC049584]|uniref:hypothetical protein n=1 Tax=Kribbella sp. NPDC049584 TaxID=3154833 RepID=UPI00343C4438